MTGSVPSLVDELQDGVDGGFVGGAGEAFERPLRIRAFPV
jgi:hypothetical protein